MRELSTEHARKCLAQLGLSVEDIEAAPDAKRADLRARWGHEEYLVEAKERKPHREWLTLRKQASAGTPGSIERAIEPWQVLAEVVEKAQDQLLATPSADHAFRVLWSVAPHADDGFIVACLERCLLGNRMLSVFASPDDPGKMLECYHYSENSFEVCTNLDGAVLSDRNGGRLYVNYYSSSIERFRGSYLYKRFAERNAVLDPEAEVDSGVALMLARDFSGVRDGTAQWQYLKDKYGLLTSVATDNQFSALLVIPIAESDEDTAG